MKRDRHTPEQIIRKLREADADLAAGIALAAIGKKLEIVGNTDYRRRNQFAASRPTR